MAPNIGLKGFVTGKSTGYYRDRYFRAPLIRTRQGSLTNSCWLIKSDYLFLLDALVKRSEKPNMVRGDFHPDEKQIWSGIAGSRSLLFNRAVASDDGCFDDETLYIYRVFDDEVEVAFKALYIEYLIRNIPEFSIEYAGENKPCLIYSGNVFIGALMNVRL